MQGGRGGLGKKAGVTEGGWRGRKGGTNRCARIQAVASRPHCRLTLTAPGRHSWIRWVIFKFLSLSFSPPANSSSSLQSSCGLVWSECRQVDSRCRCRESQGLLSSHAHSKHMHKHFSIQIKSMYLTFSSLIPGRAGAVHCSGAEAARHLQANVINCNAMSRQRWCPGLMDPFWKQQLGSQPAVLTRTWWSFFMRKTKKPYLFTLNTYCR